jgi:hypothetical protein
MLSEILAHADLIDTLGNEIKDRIFHPSGWSAPNDTDSGISFGAGPELGLGYMRMDVKDERSAKSFTLRGGYVELGFGGGETIESKALATAAGRRVAAWVARQGERSFIKKSSTVIRLINKWLKKPQTDLVVLPGGSLTQFMMGPFMTRGSLQVSDFTGATWCYVYFEGDAGAGANLGVMMMLDVKVWELSLAKIYSYETGGLLAMIAGCKAWAPYWGLGVSLSLDVKVGVRLIQDVQMVPLSNSLF